MPFIPFQLSDKTYYNAISIFTYIQFHNNCNLHLFNWTSNVNLVLVNVISNKGIIIVVNIMSYDSIQGVQKKGNESKWL